MEDKGEKTIRVALVAPSMARVGGQSIQADRLLEAFSGDEKIRMVFVPNDPETFGRRVKFLRTVTTSLKFWLSLAAEIRRADIVHVFSSGTTSYVISTLPPLVAARLYGKKTILHYHTGEAETHLKNWKTASKTMRLFDRIIVPSQFLVDVFAKFGLQAKAIFNFVDAGKFKFRERRPLSSEPVFLSNRNFEAHYQVDDVLRAFSLIQEKSAGARLIVAGYGSREAQLRKLAADLKLKNVEFVGRVEPDKMPEIYDRADIYLNSSVVDNMPLSIIEAFSCGLPVVSTDAGGIPYIVEHEKTGLLVPSGDHAALAAAALRLLEDQALASEIAKNALESGRNFTPEKIRTEWRKLYGDFGF